MGAPRDLALAPPGPSCWSAGPTQPGRRSSSSGRAVQSTRIGAERAQSDELVDEVEQAVVGPVQVFEDEDERMPVGQRLEEPPPGREALALRRSRLLAGALQPDEAPEPSRHPLGLARIVGHLLDGRAQLALDIRLRVGLEDSRFGLDDLRQRPEADAFAVGQRAALAPV